MQRREWMQVLALSTPDELDRVWTGLERKPAFAWLVVPHFGAVMVRARADGSGRPFNLGEVTVTRCSLRLESGMVGIACLTGRHKRRAALAAAFDALLQEEGPVRGPARRSLDVLQGRGAARRRALADAAQTSRVTFDMRIACTPPKPPEA